MRRPRSVSRETMVATALVGTIAGHWLAYAAAFRDSAVRHSALASTGHSWLHLARQAIVVLAIAAALSVGVDVVRRHRARAAAPRFGRLALGLGAFQIGSYLVVELAERIAAH